MDRTCTKLFIKSFKASLVDAFHQDIDISILTQKLVKTVDHIIIQLFNDLLAHGNHFCLLALGSYGRQELQPYSDIDILLLHPQNISKQQLLPAQQFIQACWDLGFDLSHQITTIDAYAQLASQDITVVSSFLDRRYLIGRKDFLETLTYMTHPLHLWNSVDFFYAKQEEQKQRYQKYRETAYNLEPNVKNGAGGLRDLQILLNISKRHFGIQKLAEGIHFGFITTEEHEEFCYCQRFLWKVRFALHIIAGKKEDRLLFDYQQHLATLFGYIDDKHSLAIEQFMKTYFMVIKRSRELNEILLQWFSETIVHHQKQCITPLNRDFQLSNEYIEARHGKVFSQNPPAILEVFLWIVNYPNIKGVRASTIRLIRQHLYLIDKPFCQNREVQQIFLSILKSRNNPYPALQRMSRYGVLGYYLESFALVAGQMQYDLYHVFTVDQHTLFVIRNLGHFFESHFERQFPLCYQLIHQISKPWLLYLAALFHDIGKGRGGNHSKIGAHEAEIFAQRHHLTEKDTALLTWLVEHHLLMSHTAQQQDIYDPNVIRQFCNQLPQTHYLNYLYLLTVADICATNPALWNTWRDSLLKELYIAANNILHREKELHNEATLIKSRQEEALKLLFSAGYPKKHVKSLWQTFKSKYFLHESANSIATHTQAILTSTQYPLILLLPHHSGGGTEVFIYMPHQDKRFKITTTILTNFHVTIQEANVLTCHNHFDLDTYIVLDKNTQQLLETGHANKIKEELLQYLTLKEPIAPRLNVRRQTRIQAHFKVTPKISFSNIPNKQHTKMILMTTDKPGLLANLSAIMLEENILLHQAKIATFGERVEDTFYLSTRDGKPLSTIQQYSLQARLKSELK